ncbi:MAG: flagellar export chaperone FliS [Ghiorsea sp.]
MTGYKAYQGKQIEGSGPLGLVLLSYDALYKSLGRAQLAIAAKEVALEADHTARAMEAIIELSSSLNFEAGQEISTNLANLYKYMMDKLVGGMCSGKSDHIVEVMKLVETLYEGWQELEQQQKLGIQAQSKHVSIVEKSNVTHATSHTSHANASGSLLGYAA